ncbi:MAG: acyltransferase family protein, partial [Nocardioides sp.]|nr:acyltransferase family protein [Nocardioides sp.]
PVADLVGNLWQEDASYLDYLAETEFAVMWFVAALLACSFGYAALRSLTRVSPRPQPPGRRTLVAATVIITVGSLLVWQVTTLLDTHLMNVRVAAWTQGAVLFALGARAWESGSSGQISRAQERRLGYAAAGGLLAALVLLVVEALRDGVDDAVGGFGWASISFAILYGVVSVAFTLWCVAWVRRRWPTHGSLMEKAGRGSYATYVSHPLVLVSVMVAFRPLPLGAELKFVMVTAVAVPLCFGVGYLLTRLPGVSRVI